MKNKKKLLALIPFLLILFLGISYAAFTYVNRVGNNQFILGDLRFNYYDSSPTIRKTKVFPETKEEARDTLLHPTSSVMIDGYDYSYQDNEIIFKVDCLTPLNDFYYSIGVTEGDPIEGKIRLDPKFIRLDFYGIDPDTHEETQILDNYALLNNYFDEVLLVDTISTEEVKLFKIRFWYDDSVVVSNSVETADYTATEFSNGYYSVKMHIDASFNQHYYDYSYMRRYSSTEFWPNSINNIKNSVKNISFLKLTDQLLNEYNNATISYDATDYNYPDTKQIYVYTRNNDQDLVITSESLILFPSDSNHALSGFTNTDYVDIDITNVNTTEVQNMSYFLYNDKYLRNITSSNNNHLRTPKVTTMANFLDINGLIIHPNFTDESFNYLIKDFDTSNVTNMRYMFSAITNVQTMDLRHFDVSKVTNMESMFYHVEATTINIDGWNTSSLTNMSYIFDGTSNLTNIDLSQMDVGLVTNMDYAFKSTGLPVINLTTWKTSSLTSVSNMFESATSKEINIAYIDTSKIDSMNQMFKGCTNLEKVNISGFDFKTNSFSQMFENCSKLEVIDLSNTTIGNIENDSNENMEGMFNGCTKLKTIYVNEDWTSLDTNVTAYDMFTGCTSLVGAVQFDSSHVQQDMANYTTGYFTLKAKPLIKNLYQYNNRLQEIETIEITQKSINSKYFIDDLEESGKVKLYVAGKHAYIIVTERYKMPVDCSYFFANLPNLKEIKGLNNLDFSETENVSHLFDGNTSLIKVDSKYIDSIKIKDASYMFNNCSSIEEINVANLKLHPDDDRNDNINYMFANCTNLESIWSYSFNSYYASGNPDNYLYALLNDRKLKIQDSNLTFGHIIDLYEEDYSRMAIISRLSFYDSTGVLSNTVAMNKLLYVLSNVQDAEYVDYRYSSYQHPEYNGTIMDYKLEWIDDEAVPVVQSFYKRGPESETLIFNNKCWKLLSINADRESGAIYTKLIYHGPVKTDKNGNKSCPSSNLTNNLNFITNSSGNPIKVAYASTLSTQFMGYMHGSANDTLAHATSNSTDSPVKELLDTWYEEEGFEQYEFYIYDAPYCNDRSIDTEERILSGASYDGTDAGYNDNMTIYNGMIRVKEAPRPIMSCENINDRFTVSNENGNGKLKHPIGIITADEAMYSGAAHDAQNLKLFYRNHDTNPDSWTMTPLWHINAKDQPYRSTYARYAIITYDKLYEADITATKAVQPVIALNAQRIYLEGGNGTDEKPYIIDMTSTREESISF